MVGLRGGDRSKDTEAEGIRHSNRGTGVTRHSSRDTEEEEGMEAGMGLSRGMGLNKGMGLSTSSSSSRRDRGWEREAGRCWVLGPGWWGGWC